MVRNGSKSHQIKRFVFISVGYLLRVPGAALVEIRGTHGKDNAIDVIIFQIISHVLQDLEAIDIDDLKKYMTNEFYKIE